MTWKLKKGVKWHDGKPFTADDCRLQLGIRQRSGDRRGHDRLLQGRQGREGRRLHRAGEFRQADAVLGRRLRRPGGMIIPKHLFDAYTGAKSREAPANLKPVGTGPYKFVDFKPGDMVRGEINPELPRRQPAVLRHDRDEGRRRRGLGGARGAADRRIRLRLEHAGRGRDPAAPGEGGGKGRVEIIAGRQHRAHPAQHHRPVDRGRRRALEPQDQAPDAQRPGGAPGAAACWSIATRSRSTSTAAPASRPANFLNNPARFVSKNTQWEFNVDKANQMLDEAGWKTGADGIRAKDGKKLKFVFQTSINAPRQKTQAIIKQACQKAGIDMEIKSVMASVFFSSDVANPDTYPQFYCRPPDVHDDDDAARSRGCS